MYKENENKYENKYEKRIYVTQEKKNEPTSRKREKLNGKIRKVRYD